MVRDILGGSHIIRSLMRWHKIQQLLCNTSLLFCLIFRKKKKKKTQQLDRASNYRVFLKLPVVFPKAFESKKTTLESAEWLTIHAYRAENKWCSWFCEGFLTWRLLRPPTWTSRWCISHPHLSPPPPARSSAAGAFSVHRSDQISFREQRKKAHAGFIIKVPHYALYRIFICFTADPWAVIR